MNIEETINKIVDRVLNETLSEQEGKWIQKVDMDKGAFTEYCKGKGMLDDEGDVTCECAAEAKKEGGEHAKQAQLYLNMNKDKCKSLKEDYEEMDHEDRSEFDSRKSKVVGVDSDNETEDGLDPELGEEAKPDFLDLDKDGDKEEPMKQAAKDAKNESKKNVVALSESEMIELIQRLVMEQKEAKGLKDTERILKDSKKVNDEAMEMVNKKMKDYVKTGSKEAYTPDAKHFPEGNGDLGEMEKEAYTPSEGVEEYITQIARSGGMENLEYDQIKPDEEWIDMNIVGSSKTGNSPEYANAVKTKANDEVKVRKDRNILAKLKNQSYNKAEQPVTDYSGKKKHTEKMAGIDVNESVKEEKTTKKVNEDIERMKSLLGHGYKTQ